MRLTHLLTVPAASGAIILLGMSSASAGEINGTGNPPRTRQGAAHANSICGFSGLEDGGEAGFPGPGVAAPELGPRPPVPPAMPARKGEQPGDSCNGHTGFLAGGGEEP